ncbi:MAG: phosphopeptide-binding protein [Microscillaceae bacterium]|nr:phosphopeptide-binding protein [Microscillaceae bacterium]
MKQILKISFRILCLSFWMFSCQSSESNTHTKEVASTEEQETLKPNSSKPKYIFTEVYSQEFPEAGIRLNNLQEGQKLPTGKFFFNFSTHHYELGKNTVDAPEKVSINAPEGQHIHLILDNSPYRPQSEITLDEGGHVLLAFLCRSYFISLKNKEAFVLRTFTAGNAKAPNFDPKGAHLFYHQPKADNRLAPGDQLLLDFYLINTTLAPNGNKVRATINGEKHLIEKWTAYSIAGLENGDISIKLELIDKDGLLIEGPFNVVERTVTLKTIE